MAYRPQLAPLSPDAFLRWWWEMEGGRGPLGGPVPLTLEDVWFEYGIEEIPLPSLHRAYVGLAARVRRNQRLGREPWADLPFCVLATDGEA
jgi:hypothetical protein